MRSMWIWVTVLLIIWSAVLSTATDEIKTATDSSMQIESGTNDDEYDSESARKIIGSRVVTSVSVVMNGKEPQFADAVGNYIPRPLVPPRVASPVSLLDPDRYEFYTFNDSGDLVKRLMTMDEIQSIVASGDSEQQVLAKTPTGIVDQEANIRDIVNNVQKVLHKEMASNPNFTASLMYNKLDTPDTSSSWSNILPAFFGNTGEPIVSRLPSTQTTSKITTHHTTTSKKPLQKTPNTSTPSKTTIPAKTSQATTKITKQKPKPTLAVSSLLSTLSTTVRPLISSTVDIKTPSSFGTTHKFQATIKNTLAPNKNSYIQPSTVYPSKLANLSAASIGTRQPITQLTGKPLSTIKIENPTQFTAKPTPTIKVERPTYFTGQPSSTVKIERPTQFVGQQSTTIKVERPTYFTGQPSSTVKIERPTQFFGQQSTTIKGEKPTHFTGQSSSTNKFEKPRPGISTTYRPTSHLYSDRITDTAFNTIPTNRPVQSTKYETKAPVTQTKITSPPRTSTTLLYTKGTSHATRLPLPIDSFYTSTKRDPSISSVAFISSSSLSSSPPSSLLPTKPASTTTTKKRTTATPTTTTSITNNTKKQKIRPTTAEAPTTVTHRPLTTVNLISIEKRPSSRRPTVSPIPPTTLSPPNGFDPEPENVFDSELSLNQIIESLKDLEGTTMPYAQDVMEYVDVTTESDTAATTTFEKVNTESVTVYNNGHDLATRGNTEKGTTNYFKQSMGNQVSYIPQTTIYPSYLYEFIRPKNQTTVAAKKPAPIRKTAQKKPVKVIHVNIHHKEGDDEMDDMTLPTDANDFTTTTLRSTFKQSSPSAMESMSTREAFDSIVQTNEATAMFEEDEDVLIPTTTTDMPFDTTKTPNDRRKTAVVKPTPFVVLNELGEATEPMKYFESIIKHYEQQKQQPSGEETTTDSTEKGISIETTPNNDDLQETTTDGTTSGNFIRINENGTQSDEFTTMDSDLTTTEYSTENADPSLYSTENHLEVTNRMASATASVGTTTESSVPTTVRFDRRPTERLSSSSVKIENREEDVIHSTARYEDLETSTYMDDLSRTTTAVNDESTTEILETADESPAYDANQTLYERIKLIENITKTMLNNSLAMANATDTVNFIDIKLDEDDEEEDSDMSSTTIQSDFMTDTSDAVKFDESTAYADLGEFETTTAAVIVADVKLPQPVRIPPSKNRTTTKTSTKTHIGSKLKLPTLAPILNNLKMKVVNALKNSGTITLEPAPKQALGLEESTAHAGEDILEFTRFCNDVAFNFWIALNNDGISSARSLALSPFAITSMLAVLFLGARGRTSAEINELLHLDDIVTFNPHALLRNVSESVDEKHDDNIHTNAFVREILSDRSRGKILSFFKEKVHQFYGGYVEEVNFSTVNDIIRRRTNLLMKRETAGISTEYLKTNNVWARPPLAGISANIFEMDCSGASRVERDGEMFFQVLPAIRQRRLVPIPAVVFKSGFTAGYDPELDATVVAVGLSKNVVSTIFVMPGQQGHLAPGDNLERLESVLMINAVSKNAWRRLLATLMERPGLEVQIPRFTHRSFVNATNSLRKLGLETLFDQSTADLRGIFGAITKDMFVSDLIQINTFSTCGEDKAGESHHVEMYPAPPNKHRTVDYGTSYDFSATSSTTASTSSVVPNYESERAFATDPLYDLKYLNLPLPLRPRQARIPEAPRLRFDKPFVYFVRHNPTGLVLYFGRFNPRLLP